MLDLCDQLDLVRFLKMFCVFSKSLLQLAPPKSLACYRSYIFKLWVQVLQNLRSLLEKKEAVKHLQETIQVQLVSKIKLWITGNG